MGKTAEKQCSKCHEVKALSEFWRNTSSPDGRRSVCAACERAPRLSLADTFWQHVEKADSGCWLWEHTLTSTGYGTFVHEGERYYTHRLSWELHNGSIPDGLNVCHKCDVRNCVRPSHLFIGTQKDNMEDAAKKGRMEGPKGTVNGRSILDESDVREIRKLLADGELTHKEIADRKGVHKNTVSAINTRQIWGWLQ